MLCRTRHPRSSDPSPTLLHPISIHLAAFCWIWLLVIRSRWEARRVMISVDFPSILGRGNITTTYLCSTRSEYSVWNTASTANGKFLSIPLSDPNRSLRVLDTPDDIQTDWPDDDSWSSQTSESGVRTRGRVKLRIRHICLCRDLKAHDYVIESMHAIDSDRIKYPAKRDVNWTRNGKRVHLPRWKGALV